MTAFDEWESFYVIVGSSAGALIGLQFVVLTLIAESRVIRGEAQAGGAFASPTVVHFGAVLGLSAVVSAPWHGVRIAAVLLGLVGVAGVAYVGIVARRLRSQTAYRPVPEDWWFHVLLPLAAYAVLAGSACAAWSRPRFAAFLVGGAALFLLFIGIHNAWDAVVYQVFVRRREEVDAARSTPQQQEGDGP
jgi:hypothetical protein